MKTPTLSFCITCKNRISQISRTLPENLKNNNVDRDHIQFVLVDFGSNDGLKEWVKQNFLPEINVGYLKYIYTDELPSWHASVGKNTAHLLADNEILVNLDCDNFTGVNGGRFVINKFLEYGKEVILHQFDGKCGGGTYGRISVYGEYFKKVGGYDESFCPMAFQDEDLTIRLRGLGLKHFFISDPAYSSALLNTKEEGLANTKTNLSYNEMQIINRNISKNNLYNGTIVVNKQGWGIHKNLFDIYGEQIKIE